MLAKTVRAESYRVNSSCNAESAEHRGEAVATFDPRAVALRIKARGEMVAGKGEPIGRHPMIGEREGCGDISGARACLLPTSSTAGHSWRSWAAASRRADRVETRGISLHSKYCATYLGSHHRA